MTYFFSSILIAVKLRRAILTKILLKSKYLLQEVKRSLRRFLTYMKGEDDGE
jgi:hypothetical protein